MMAPPSTLTAEMPFLTYCKRLLTMGLALILINCGPCPDPSGKLVQARAVIFDTDISSDVDDVGAVSLLHALADIGDIEILATVISSGDPWSAPCLDALNTYLSRPDIPIGAVRGPSVVHRSKYTQQVANAFRHDLGMAADSEDAVTLYRKILASRKDCSVDIVTVGYLTNLGNLLHSPPDGFSELDGRTLVKKKVRHLVCMGGKYPSGREWNFYQDASAARNVTEHWPGPIVFVGFETGVAVLTGAGLKDTPANNPVRRCYELYNGLMDRPSWDQMAVLYTAKRGHGAFAHHWELVSGRNSVSEDGSNRWMDRTDRNHFYLRLKKSPEIFSSKIEQLMILPILSRSE